MYISLVESSYSLIVGLVVEAAFDLVVRGQGFSVVDLSLKKDSFFNYLVSLRRSTKH